MVQTRFATVEDLEKLRDCELQIWESLKEWLPDSFVTPNMDYIRRSEYLQNWQQMLQNKEVIYLVSEKDHETIGVATGRVREDGVGMLGFLGIKRQY